MASFCRVASSTCACPCSLRALEEQNFLFQLQAPEQPPDCTKEVRRRGGLGPLGTCSGSVGQGDCWVLQGSAPLGTRCPWVTQPLAALVQELPTPPRPRDGDPWRAAGLEGPSSRQHGWLHPWPVAGSGVRAGGRGRPVGSRVLPLESATRCRAWEQFKAGPSDPSDRTHNPGAPGPALTGGKACW